MEALLYSLQVAKQYSECVALAREASPKLRLSPSAATLAGSGLDCALSHAGRRARPRRRDRRVRSAGENDRRQPAASARGRRPVGALRPALRRARAGERRGRRPRDLAAVGRLSRRRGGGAAGSRAADGPRPEPVRGVPGRRRDREGDPDARAVRERLSEGLQPSGAAGARVPDSEEGRRGSGRLGPRARARLRAPARPCARGAGRHPGRDGATRRRRTEDAAGSARLRRAASGGAALGFPGRVVAEEARRRAARPNRAEAARALCYDARSVRAVGLFLVQLAVTAPSVSAADAPPRPPSRPSFASSGSFDSPRTRSSRRTRATNATAPAFRR